MMNDHASSPPSGADDDSAAQSQQNDPAEADPRGEVPPTSIPTNAAPDAGPWRGLIVVRRFGTQVGNQFGSQFGSQFGNQFGNQFGSGRFSDTGDGGVRRPGPFSRFLALLLLVVIIVPVLILFVIVALVALMLGLLLALVQAVISPFRPRQFPRDDQADPGPIRPDRDGRENVRVIDRSS